MDEICFAGIYPIFSSETANMNFGSSTAEVGPNESFLFKFWNELKHSYLTFNLRLLYLFVQNRL